jgi:hypothetical protein
MDKVALFFAKVAALKKSFETVEYDRLSRTIGSYVEPLFSRYETLIKEAKELLPEYYSDLPDIKVPKTIGHSSDGPLFEKFQIDPLRNNLDYILEVRSNSRIGENISDKEKLNFIFISHGRSKEWFKIQAYLEKDLDYSTIELA